jgi:DNA mismatch endonuclease (patch repair protein)
LRGCGVRRTPPTRRSYWVAKIDRNADRDRRTRRTLSRLGWRVLVVWECQTKHARRKVLTRQLEAFLNA